MDEDVSSLVGEKVGSGEIVGLQLGSESVEGEHRAEHAAEWVVPVFGANFEPLGVAQKGVVAVGVHRPSAAGALERGGGGVYGLKETTSGEDRELRVG